MGSKEAPQGAFLLAKKIPDTLLCRVPTKQDAV
jgi:hypothetical protein